jgi:hypothetical protein
MGRCNSTAVPSSAAVNRKPPSPIRAMAGRPGAASFAPKRVAQGRQADRIEVAARAKTAEGDIGGIGELRHVGGDDGVVGNGAAQYAEGALVTALELRCRVAGFDPAGRCLGRGRVAIAGTFVAGQQWQELA